VTAAWSACAGALLLPFAFYYYTSAPGIGMGDTAMLIESAFWLELRAHASVHNIAILIGRLFLFLPGYDPARELNLASVFTGGAAVLLYGLLLLRVLRSKVVALLCTGVLMVSRSMWWHSTIAESYAVNAVFVVWALWLLFAPGGLRDRRLVLLFFIGGLALFNHVQLGIIVVGATVSLVLAVRKGGRIVTLPLLCAGGFLVGLIPWLIVFRQEVLRSGLATTLSLLRGGKWRTFMFEGEVPRGVSDVLYLVFEHFPGPFLLAIPVGLVILVRRYEAKQSWGFLAMLALNTGFFAMYDTWDRYAFLLPSFIMLAFAGSLAVDALWDRLSRVRLHAAVRVALVAAMLFSLVFPPWFYSKLAGWGDEEGFWSRRYDNEYHGNIVNFAEYLANPNKRHWRDTEEYANLLFDRLPEDAVYIDDDSRTHFPIQYFRRYFHKRNDLRAFMINSWKFTGWGIDEAEFTEKLQHAWRSDGDLFLPTLRHPFDRFIPARVGGRPVEFQIVYLDERRHIYRLLTSADMSDPLFYRRGDRRRP
jgi:hypothetical protein